MDIKKFVKRHRFLYFPFSFVYYFKWNVRKLFNYKILDQDKLLHRNGHYSYVEFGSEDIASYEKPVFNCKNIPKPFQFYIGNSFQLPASFYSVHNDASLVGPEAIGVTLKNEIILDTTMSQKNLLDKCSPKLFNNINELKIQRDYDCAISLVNLYNNAFHKNYFHWIVDCLFSLDAVERYKEAQGVQPHLIINKSPTQYQLESLNILGYSCDDFSEWDSSRVRAKKLIVPGSRRIRICSHDIISPSAIKWFRDKVKQQIPPAVHKKEFSKNIFISRKNSKGRKISNYDEFRNVLDDYGFKSYCLEEMTFSDQVELFSGAKNIIGAHGAGLVNIIFCSSANVIECIGHPYSRTPCMYYDISQSLGHRHGLILCKSYRKIFIDYRENDIILDNEKLMRMLGALI